MRGRIEVNRQRVGLCAWVFMHVKKERNAIFVRAGPGVPPGEDETITSDTGPQAQDSNLNPNGSI